MLLSLLFLISRNNLVPPFGSLWGLKTYMDVSLRTEKEIDFNCGLRTRSVHMHQADYERIEKPTVVTVATLA